MKSEAEDNGEVLKKVYNYYSIKASEYIAKGKDKQSKSSAKSEKKEWDIDFEETIIPERVDRKEDRG